MAKKILRGLGGLVGIGKKKTAPADAAAATEKTGPIITQLGGAVDPRKRRSLGGLPGQIGSILSDKLGA